MMSRVIDDRRADWLAKSIKNRERELSSMGSRWISRDDARRFLGVTRSTFERWSEGGRYAVQ